MGAKSIIAKADVQMFLVLVVTGIAGTLILQGRPVPDILEKIWLMAWVFYYTAKENGAERDHLVRMAKGG